MYHHQLNARSETSGRTFTIVFATAAVAVVIICLIWGFIVPRYRKKRHPPRPPSALFNTASFTDLSAATLPRDFPSHPALCRDLRKRPSGLLRQYDPRSETPFPNTPPLGESVSLPSITPRTYSAADIHTSHGLFSPAKDRQPSRRGAEDANEHDNATIAGDDQDHNDYTLAMPEPCLLQAKPAGRAPPLKRQLDKFPMPRSGSGQTDKLAHPNKLFKDLELRESSISIGTPSLLPADHEQDMVRIEQDDLTHGKALHTTLVDVKKEKTFDLPQEYEMKHWRLRRLERRGTWSSTAESARAHLQVQRAGTLTKLKTPVADHATHHENQSQLKMPDPCSSKNGTITSSDYQKSVLSSHVDPDTPPTSPVNGSSMASLPQFAHDAVETPTPYLGHDRATPSSMALPSGDRLAPMCTIPEDKLADAKKASIFKQMRPLACNRPTRLNLNEVRKSPSLRKRFQRHSMSSVNSLLVPLVRSKRPSIQASSIYSRDTLGVSITHSPLSPAFGESLSTGIIDKPGNLRRKASSIDLLRTKIDDWRLDTPEIENFSASPSSEFKRAISVLGPYSPTFPDSGFGSLYKKEDAKRKSHNDVSKEVPTICIGRASDDIFRDPLPDIETGTLLKRGSDVDLAGPMASLSEAPMRGTAPGGADWL